MQNKENMAVFVGTFCLLLIMCLAIVDQEFSWWVFPFIALFGALFAGVLSVCFSIYRADTYRDSMKAEYPDQPWMWHAKWRSDVIPSRSRWDFWGAVVFTIILSVFALSGVAATLDGLPSGNLWTILGLIPLIVLFFVVQYMIQAWRTLRYEKRVSLVLETRPAWIGSAFSARLVIPAGTQPEHLEAQLEHTEIVRVEESDGVSFEKAVDSKISGHVETSFDDAGHCTGSIVVDIPSHSPESSWHEDDLKGWWEMIITMRIEGVDIPLRYEVPVADPVRYPTDS
ncbi:MAG: hypothetical protein ACRBM6_30720 [Geminicoccales bacterium]